MHVVVVESPAKAKTVQQYLGGDYRVLATWGHVRDLPAKEGSVRPDSCFAMTYASGPRARRVLGRIRAALKGADSLILATDPDREGEAIAWQVLTWLQERDAMDERPVRRVAFHEITPEAVRAAMASPREIDMDLVHAQQARRALDYLVGFHLTPVLWAEAAGQPLGGPCAVGGAPPDLRARGGDRGLRSPPILDRRGARHGARRRHLHGKAEQARRGRARPACPGERGHGP